MSYREQDYVAKIADMTARIEEIENMLAKAVKNVRDAETTPVRPAYTPPPKPCKRRLEEARWFPAVIVALGVMLVAGLVWSVRTAEKNRIEDQIDTCRTMCKDIDMVRKNGGWDGRTCVCGDGEYVGLWTYGYAIPTFRKINDPRRSQ